MINYIKSEIYRTFRTPSYKYFMIFSLLVTIVTMGLYNNFIGEDYMILMGIYSVIALWIILGLTTELTFKTKDTKVQILSFGISREKMYFMDIISNIILIIMTTVILACLALASGFIGNTLGLVDIDRTYLKFLRLVGYSLIFVLNSSLQIMGLSYILNSANWGMIGSFFIIPMITQILYSIKSNVFFKSLHTIQACNLMTISLGMTAENYGPDIMKYTLMSFAFSIVVYLLGGLVAFKKREIQ